MVFYLTLRATTRLSSTDSLEHLGANLPRGRPVFQSPQVFLGNFSHGSREHWLCTCAVRHHESVFPGYEWSMNLKASTLFARWNRGMA